MYMDKQLYFAYGSNMDTVQMEYRCPGARKVGVARLNGFRFIINSRGVASVVEDARYLVKGILWEISDDDIESLDSYEGVAGGFYHKAYMQVVVIEKNTPVSAFVYVARDTSHGTARGGYLEKIVCSADDHCLGEEYIDELRSWGIRSNA